MNSSSINMEPKDNNCIYYCVVHIKIGFQFAKHNGVCGFDSIDIALWICFDQA